MNNIPFFDLAATQIEVRPALNAAYERVLSGSSLILGEEVQAFEQEFADSCGVGHCIGVGNGLDALALTLQAWDIGPGDEVIVPSHTFIATWLAVNMVGATPVPVEVEPETFLLDVRLTAKALTERTKAVIPVHLYGKAFDVEALRAVLPSAMHVLEDAAQAHGASIKGKFTGALGDAAAFSFYPTKNLGALGDGGAITTNDASLAMKLRNLRNYGSSKKYVHDTKGVNSRLDELQAAFLRAKLPSLKAWNSKRISLAKLYSARLAGIEGLQLPTFGDDGADVFHLYVIGTSKREELQKHLLEHNISTLVHYPIAPHQQLAYKDYSEQRLPIAENCAKHLLSLPLWPQMTQSEVNTVCDSIQEFFDQQ